MIRSIEHRCHKKEVCRAVFQIAEPDELVVKKMKYCDVFENDVGLDVKINVDVSLCLTKRATLLVSG